MLTTIEEYDELFGKRRKRKSRRSSIRRPVRTISLSSRYNRRSPVPGKRPTATIAITPKPKTLSPSGRSAGTYPHRSIIKNRTTPVNKATAISSSTPARSYRGIVPSPVKLSTSYKPTIKTSAVRASAFRKRPIKPTVIPAEKPSNVKQTIQKKSVSRLMGKTPKKTRITRSTKKKTVADIKKLIKPLPMVFVRPSVKRPPVRTSRIAKISRSQKRSSVKPVIATVRKPAIRPAAKKNDIIRLVGQPIRKAVKTPVSPKQKSKTLSNTNRLIKPFPIGRLPTPIKKLPSITKPIVFKSPKTLAPIRSVISKTSAPKSTGPIGKIVIANPSLKPTLAKPSKNTTQKPTIVTKKKAPVVRQPKPTYHDQADKPIRPGNDNEIIAKPENRPSSVKKAIKITGWVAGAILATGLIAHYLIIPNIKDE